MEEEDQFDQEEVDNIENLEQIKKEAEELKKVDVRYARPKLNMSHFSEENDCLFMQIDCDYYTQSMQIGDKKQQIPIIRMFSLNEHGNSAVIHIKGFVSYFYVEAPDELELNKSNLEKVKAELNKRAQKIRTVGEGNDAVDKIEVVQKESVKEFKGVNYQKQNFLKIYTHLPVYVASLRSLFEAGLNFDKISFVPKVYEANMPYALRFMIDKDIVGMGWVKLKAGQFTQRQQNQCFSRCQIEFDVNIDGIEAISTNEKADIAPLRIMSFDIECGAKQGFPSAFKDPIIQIACILKVHNESEELVKYILSLRECAPIPGAIVKNFKDKKTDDENEKDLLLEFQRFVQLVDPDIFIGYNITNFDFPYILNRAQHLKVGGGKESYGFLGRMVQIRTKLKDGKYLSKQMGMRDTKEMNFEGRVQLDMLMHMQMSQKLSSYTLNNVASLYLGSQKEDVHHSIIYTLWEQNPETRKRLAVYCLKDAVLPLQLMEKMMCIYNYCEMARVTGVPIIYLFVRGQQIKVASQMYRKAKQVGMIIPSERSNKSEGKFEGAFVLDPISNFYEVPVATLDFASLYPSIMMAHNLCYSTLIKNPRLREQMNPDDITKTPHGDYFVKKTVREGLLPQILHELLSARKQAKKELAQETDPFKKAVLDGRQLALKVSANSVYGFTGAQVGQLPCLEISSSVTSFGREMIMQTKKLVMEKYNKKNGYEDDSIVVYGDTDSVMVKFGVKTVAEAMELGKEAAGIISQTFLPPIKLEFEKVYFPYLLMNKKRYAGVYWTRPEKYDKIDTKGIENVRRDNCKVIRTLIDQVLKEILVTRNKEEACNLVKRAVSQLLQNKVDMSNLVITKSLSKQGYDENDDDDDDTKQNDNKYKVRMAHVELAEKMAKRDPGSAPQQGDRVPYVMIAGAKGARNYENAEDPIEVLNKDLPIDFDYYIDKQIKPPLLRIFKNVIPNPQSLFTGEHTKKRYQPKIQNTAFGKFAIVKKTCLNCKQVVKNDNAVCGNCEQQAMEIYTQKICEFNQNQQQFADAWTQCQRCQGSLHDEVICSNKDCPIFYKRTKLRKDLQEQQKVLDRFNNDW